jgi:hypothetical protein
LTNQTEPNTTAVPFANSAIARYLAEQIDAISDVKDQKQIACEIGYVKTNIISLFKRGEAKIPLDKVPALARALNVDPAHLFRLALEQYWPGAGQTIDEIFGRRAAEKGEAMPLKDARDATKNPVPSVVEKSAPGVDKLDSEGSAAFVDLNFKVPPRFHRRFRMEASARGLSMKELLVASFQAYLDAHGGTMQHFAEDLMGGRA